MAIRKKSAADPAAEHFKAAEEVLEVDAGADEAVPMGPPYRRRIVEAAGPDGAPVRHKTLWFAGARSGFLSNATDGVVTVDRTLEDVRLDGVDGIGVTLVIGGHIRVRSGPRDERFEAGQMFIEDTGVARTAVSGLNPGGLVYIPRERFVEAIPTPIDQINLMRVDTAPLAPLVSQQIEFLVRGFGRLAPDEFEAVLESVIELSLIMVRKSIVVEAEPEDPVLLAAKAYIADHFHDPELSPDSLARALGCSRAVLYRAFARSDQTVVRYLRDVRFRHFFDRLRRNPDASISQLAYGVGFSATPSDFTKLFKRTYGVTPSEAQAGLRKADRDA